MPKPGISHLKKELFPRDHHHLPIFLSLIAVMLGLSVAVVSVQNSMTSVDTHANKAQCIPLPECYYHDTCPKTIYNASTNGRIGNSSNYWCPPTSPTPPVGGVVCGNTVCQPGQTCAIASCPQPPTTTPCPPGQVCPTPTPYTCKPTYFCVGSSSSTTPTPTPGFIACSDVWPGGSVQNQGYCPKGYQCNNKQQSGAPFGICLPIEVTPLPSGYENGPTPTPPYAWTSPTPKVWEGNPPHIPVQPTNSPY